MGEGVAGEGTAGVCEGTEGGGAETPEDKDLFLLGGEASLRLLPCLCWAPLRRPRGGY